MSNNSNIEILFGLNKRLEEIIEEKFEEKYQLKTLKQSFTAFSFGKVYKTHKAVLILCEKGFGEDAAILARSIFDLGITTLYILSDKTDYLVKRYYEYDWIIRKDIYEYARTNKSLAKMLEERSANLQEGEDDLETIFKEAERAQDKYQYDKRKGWSDKSIKQMASHIGREGAYNTIYGLLSQLAHTAPRTINDYIGYEEGGFVVRTGSSFNWTENVLVISFDYFYAISLAWNKLFRLGLDSRLENLGKEWIMQVGNINDEEDK